MVKYKLQPYSLQELGQRSNQEDSIYPRLGESTSRDSLFILCDGMGGHEKGEVASATVCQVMGRMLSTTKGEFTDEQLKEALASAYDALDEKDCGEIKKMGTTMTLLKFHANGVTAAHIGDSRIYQLRPSHGNDQAQIIYKSRDHSLVNELLLAGEITEEEAKDFPQKNIITRAMQPLQSSRAKADIRHLQDIQSGDWFYMCSDGMLEQMDDQTLLNTITRKDLSDKDKVETLRQKTAQNKDNHTAHLIHVTEVKQQKSIWTLLHLVKEC